MTLALYRYTVQLLVPDAKIDVLAAHPATASAFAIQLVARVFDGDPRTIKVLNVVTGECLTPGVPTPTDCCDGGFLDDRGGTPMEDTP